MRPFDEVATMPGGRQSRLGRQARADGGEGVAVGLRFVCQAADESGSPGERRSSCGRRVTVEAEPDGRGAGDGQVRPLPLRLDAELSPRLLEGDFGRPAAHDPCQAQLEHLLGGSGGFRAVSY